jgi:hypothetical protein
MRMCLSRIFAGGLAGIAATHLMDGIGEIFYRRWMSESDRNQERAVEPKFPLVVLGERIAATAGATSESGEKIASVLHWAIGFVCGALYAAVDMRAPLRGALAAQPIAMGMLAIDEFGFYATGLAAPPGAFPNSTHVRAFLAHVTYGASLAVIYKGMTV